MAKKDYYEQLGIDKSASQSEIKKAYHKLAMQYHPDRNQGNKDAEKRFKEINEAYEVLKDEQKRAAYDKFGHDAFSQNAGGYGGGFNQQRGGFSGFQSSFHDDDFLNDFFNDFMGGQRRTRNNWQVKGSDLKYNLVITLEEAFAGVDKTISFTSNVKCDTCGGSGSEGNSAVENCDACHGAGVTRIQQGFITFEQSCGKCQGGGKILKNPCKKCRGMGCYSLQRNLLVKVPAGVENLTRMRLTGEGEAGIRGGNNGDLFVVVSIKQHDIYQVDGYDLHFKLPITIAIASLGGDIEIKTIEGDKVKLSIPAGSQNGDRLRLKGKGMSKIRSSSRGDLFAHIHVDIPKNLTKRQKELLHEFDKDLKGDNHGSDRPKDANNYGKNDSEKTDSSSGSNSDEGFINKVKSLWS